jgi:heme/copper-type cytochrome/quinol oxidase subunit 2
MKSFSQKYRLQWKVILTVLLLVFNLLLLTVEWKVGKAWNMMPEKQDALLMLQAVTLSIGMFTVFVFRQIWRKNDEEDEENTGKKWRLWRRIAQTVIVALSFLVLLSVWPSVGSGIGIGFVAVATVLIIKTWAGR